MPTLPASRILLVLILAAGCDVAVAKEPLADAVAVWHMNADRNSASSLAVEGDVTLGMELSGREQAASLRRGGDGRVACFQGGYLRAEIGRGRPSAIEGKEMTLLVRLHDLTGQWKAPLAAKDLRDDRHANILFGSNGSLHYVWQTVPIDPKHKNRSFAEGIMELRAPAVWFNPIGWHDVVVRFRGPNLELFVDGVLMDEEWPHGNLYKFAAPLLIGAGDENWKVKTGFRGLVDHVALWNRALNNEEIKLLCGGREEVERRDREILGPVATSAQYWKPRGYNAWAGDCMPFFHDGTFHLFYLFDRHHHGSKWGQGAHQYGQLSSKDLVRWQEHPLAVPIVQPWECSMGTCDCIWHNGVYHLFYTDCGNRCEYPDKPQRGSWIFCATSSDGIHFHKDLKHLVPGGDCTVFQDPATGLFHMIRGGGNRLVSKDLRNWQETPGDFVRRTDPRTTGECPRLFAWNGWFYFILGTNAIWKSRSALGPWEEIRPTIYDGLFVPKVAEFTGNRRILAGFLFERGWAGHLALRELVQYPDGSLGMKFPPEVIPACGEAKELGLAAMCPQVTGDGRCIQIKSPDRFAAGMLQEVPQDVRISLRVVPGPGAKAFGVCLRGKGNYQGGCELRFEPGRQRVQYGMPENSGMAKDSTGQVSRGRDFAIENVEGLDRPFSLEVIVKGDIIDTCIDGRRTMITRRDPEPRGDRLFFFVRDAEVRFEGITVRPLQP